MNKKKAVAIWLIIGVLMIMGQVFLGGVTRLTGSGLSIAEWKPILGVIPPMNEKSWQAAFELYKTKASGQFFLLNNNFTIHNFKAIYFWEWLHREWGRLMGIVFLCGFTYFLLKKHLNKEMIFPFIVLFILGGLQGAIGWIMVQSGLNETDTHVSHIRLAIHFIMALLLLCYVLWFALKLLIPDEKKITNHHLYRLTFYIVVILGLQLIYGAFMAGLRAAPAAPTWPTINGSWIITSNIFGNTIYHGINEFISNPLIVHFIHRTLAYILFGAITYWFLKMRCIAKKNQSRFLSRASLYPLILVCLQVLLGIITVLSGAKMNYVGFGQFEVLAELHQLVAMLLLTSLIINLYILRGKPTAR